jgi:FAD/FMN-containing dehydrogenase
LLGFQAYPHRIPVFHTYFHAMRTDTAFALLLPAFVSALSSQQYDSGTASCKTVFGDESWPAKSVWRKAMPEVESQKSKANWKQPNYRLDATTINEVSAAVNFTREHNIRLSVLNSGHDFVGRNDAPTGLTLAVGGLKGARVLSDFTPTKEGVLPVDSSTKVNVLPPQTKQAYVTFGVGTNTRELNSLLAPSRLLTLGAAHGSVSVAGGWGLTAGHAALSSQFGLGVDQVVEYKIVTADGLLRVANDVSNPDLFWALRGGGSMYSKHFIPSPQYKADTLS